MPLVATARHRQLSSGPRPHRGLSVLPIVVSLVIIILGTIAAGSTVVALRAVKERDHLRQDLSQAIILIDQNVAAVSTNSQFKGAMDPVRQELLKPALAYYQNFVKENAADPDLLVDVTAAQFHIAALQARFGMKDSVLSLSRSLILMRQLKDGPGDPETFPSVQQCALKLTPPNEWISIKGASQAEGQMHALSVFLGLQSTISLLDELAVKYPQNTTFRDDSSELRKSAAVFLGFVGRSKDALTAWLKARDTLETLVRDRPADASYKSRLAESLIAAGRLQKNEKDSQAALANFDRAVAVREELLAAKPEDKTLEKDLQAAIKDRDRLKAAQAKEKDATAAATPDAATPDAAKPDEAKPEDAKADAAEPAEAK